MINVRVREQEMDKGGISEKVETKSHEKGSYAHVYNGVLTIYTEAPKASVSEVSEKAIAGYEAHGWLSWEKQ